MLNRLVPKEGGVLAGTLATFAKSYIIELHPEPDWKKESKRPRFTVVAKAHDDWLPCGSAFQFAITRGRNSGAEGLSIVIDDPRLSEPMRFSAWPREGGGYDAKFSRAFDPSKMGPDDGDGY